MALELVSPEDPILSEVMPSYTGAAGALRGLARDMHAALDVRRPDCGRGVGLAAPQVGERVRMFVMDVDRRAFRDIYVCINPEVKASGPEVISLVEGCLTFPGRRYSVRRPKRIVAEWTDLRGKRQRREMFGLLARCFQHELDHLNGVVIGWEAAAA